MERLSRADLAIIGAIPPKGIPLGRLAEAIGLSPSHVSERVRSLRELGLVRTQKCGLSVLVAHSDSPSMAALSALIAEGSGLDLEKVLTGPGLAMLPHLLAPGRTSSDIMKRTGLSQATVRERLRVWRGMGIAVRESRTCLYRLAPARRALADFAARYSEVRNMRILGRKVPGAVIVWQDRDEFLFSVGSGTGVAGFVLAGPGALAALGYDVAHSRDYWLGGRPGRKIKEEEALVQTMLIEPGNPRAVQWIRECVKGRGLDPALILDIAGKYGLGREIGKILGDALGAKEVRAKRD